eukprot:RCo033849
MIIAIEGCCHGELDTIYATLREVEQKNGIHVDLLLCCGDFEAIRNGHDMSCLNVPPKYLHMGDFQKYYTGQAQAPCLTIFIGGNHEASNHLWELYFGGWVAPNIYFLGFSGVVNVGGLRIAGLSGIYNGRHYHLSYYERPPFTMDNKISIYHVRHFEVMKLGLIQEPVTIVMSHDWPAGIAHHGDKAGLYRRKPDFQAEIESDQFGSSAGRQLLHVLRPVYWFSAHHHVKFAAMVSHSEMSAGGIPTEAAAGWRGPSLVATATSGQGLSLGVSAIPLPPSDSAENPPPPRNAPATALAFPTTHSEATPQHGVTRFLALDKCLPHRRYLQVLGLEDGAAHRPEGSAQSSGPLELCYDLEWLAIVKLSQKYFPVSGQPTPAGSFVALKRDIEEERKSGAVKAWLLQRAAEFGGGKYA